MVPLSGSMILKKFGRHNASIIFRGVLCQAKFSFFNMLSKKTHKRPQRNHKKIEKVFEQRNLGKIITSWQKIKIKDLRNVLHRQCNLVLKNHFLPKKETSVEKYRKISKNFQRKTEIFAQFF